MDTGFLPGSLEGWLTVLGHLGGTAAMAGGTVWWALRGYIDRKVEKEESERKVAVKEIEKLVFDHAQKIHTLLAKVDEIHIQVEKGFARLEGIMEGREMARRERRNRD